VPVTHLTSAVGAPTIRRYRDADRDALYDVCIRTADNGEDARGHFSTDDLSGDIFVGPYLLLEPDLAFVLDDGERAVGYCLGTADTAGFVWAHRERWVPRMRERYAEPAGATATDEEWLLRFLFNPERMLRPELGHYPAHLHIDLLPAYQGAGHGRRLIETFIDAAAAAGAPAVHLAVATSNTRAIGFYDRLGFQPIDVAGVDGVTFLGRPTR
jgi:ribosomal protein S18 acetylase RimI-like enzyme